jgi:hypothetical protein
MAVRKKAKEETERMLEALAAKGHLEVSFEHGRLHYALWERGAPYEGLWPRRDQKRRKTHMARRRTLYLPVMIVAAVLMACAVVMLALSEKAEATFPGKNGRIAYSAFDFDGGVDETIYTIKPGGGAKTKLTRGYQPSYSPNGKRIAYTLFGGTDTEIYTINVGGGGKTQLTHNNKDENFPSYSPNGKRIAYTRIISRDAGPPISDIYTIKVGGGGKFRVTHTNNAFESGPSWGSRP